MLGWNLNVEQFLAQRLYSIVDGSDLVGADAILLYNRLACEIAHGYNMVGIVHAILLDIEHRGIHITATAVKIGSMNMYHKGLACHLLGVDAGRIGEPVVRVDDIKVDCAGYHSCHYRVVVDFLKQIVGISPRELYTPQVIGVHK